MGLYLIFIMKLIIYIFIISFSNAFAADFRVENDRLIISGSLKIEEETTIEDFFNKNHNLKTIEFFNCMSGQAGATYHLANLIADRKLNTLMNGQVHSGCAIAFLAGQIRVPVERFGTHVLGIHAPRSIDNRNVPQEYVNKMMSLVEVFTEGKISSEVKDLIKKSNTGLSGVFFVTRNFSIYSDHNTYYCNGSEDADLSKCRILKNSDPVALGIFKEKKN